MWWTKKIPVNAPLVTLANDPLGDPTSGMIGSASTSVLLGGQSYTSPTRFGGRFTLGGWFDSEGIIGIEGNYLFLAHQSITRTIASNGAPGSPTLYVPYLNAAIGAEDVTAIGGPAAVFGIPVIGNATLRLSNQVQGGELNMVGRLCRTEKLSLEALAGFRYVRFQEELDFTATDVAVGAASYSARDSFAANNNFYGGQVGLRGEYCWGNFVVSGTGKIALGTMNQTMDIQGSSSLANFSGGSSFTNAAGGFFAQPSNIGHYSRNVFCAVPEADLKLGYNITRNIQAFVGYNYLYLSNVARPGTAIDRNINPTQATFATAVPTSALVGPSAPGFSFQRSDFWAQGVNFGVMFKF